MEDCKIVEDQECIIVDDVELEQVCENMDKEECKDVKRSAHLKFFKLLKKVLA